MQRLAHLVAVVPEPRERGPLVRTLKRRFGRDYHVTGLATAEEALSHLARLREVGERVAVVIADQASTPMPAVELLGQVRALSPGAKRILLVPWGDRRSAPAILSGCAFGQLDNYLIKPWSPPETNLYPMLSEFLGEWARAFGPHTELVRVVGRDGAPATHAVRELLARKGVPCGYYPADGADGLRLLADTGTSPERLPVVVLLDGHVLVQPSPAQLADALGETNLEQEQPCDVAIVGAGPAGLAAAVAAASEGLRTVVVEREAVGGQAGTSSLIRNYLGFPRGISGAELAQRAWQQAWLFGAKYVFGREVHALRAEGTRRILTLDDGREISASAVLIASGASYRRIGNPRLERFSGAGVFYAAMGDPRIFGGKDAYVVGGGNSAGQATVWLAEGARKVTLLVRGRRLEATMSDYLIQQIQRLANVEVRLGAQVVDADGGDTLERITIRSGEPAQEETRPAQLLFAMIGARPHTDWLADALQLDGKGFVLTGRDVQPGPLREPPLQFETSLPGVFALGDARAGSIKRVASAVGEGTVAMHFVHEYLRAAGRERAPSPRPSPSPSLRDGAATAPSAYSPGGEVAGLV
ncbi:MAG: FAD-dependent oxidoreductase [Myxococcales bacterium]